MPVYRRPVRSAWAQAPYRRASSTIPVTTNGTTSQGVCFTAIASPSRPGPRQAAGPRVWANRSHRTAAPTSSGTYRTSVMPPTA